MAISDDSWVQSLAGRFIVFDGPDGSGKTTQFQLFAQWLASRHVDVCEVREPGGTPIGERIRDVLLDPALTGMSDRCELMLYMASRAQLVEQMIKPALAHGRCVLADRFLSSTLAYQGSAGGLDLDMIWSVGRAAVDDCVPDLVVVFDVDDAVSRARRDATPDRMEQKDEAYHQRVRQGYLDQARRNAETYVVIDSSRSVEDVFDHVLRAVREHAARWRESNSSETV